MLLLGQRLLLLSLLGNLMLLLGQLLLLLGQQLLLMLPLLSQLLLLLGQLLLLLLSLLGQHVLLLSLLLLLGQQLLLRQSGLHIQRHWGRRQAATPTAAVEGPTRLHHGLLGMLALAMRLQGMLHQGGLERTGWSVLVLLNGGFGQACRRIVREGEGVAGLKKCGWLLFRVVRLPLRPGPLQAWGAAPAAVATHDSIAGLTLRLLQRRLPRRSQRCCCSAISHALCPSRRREGGGGWPLDQHDAGRGGGSGLRWNCALRYS